VMARIIRGKNPRKPWTVRYQLDGRQRERSFATSREANEFRIKFEYDSRQQIFIDPKLASEPFKDAAERWITQHAGTSRTAQIYRSALAKHVGPALGSRSLAQVSQDRDAVQALTSKLGASLARASYALIGAVVNGMFRLRPMMPR
jgi:hypothetical protein